VPPGASWSGIAGETQDYHQPPGRSEDRIV
jgi:hypothetical protein